MLWYFYRMCGRTLHKETDMSSHTSCQETEAEKATRREQVAAMYAKYPFLKTIAPPGYVSLVSEIKTLHDDFLHLPHQPDGTGVEHIFFFDMNGKLAGRVGSWWQRIACAIHWNYKYHEKVAGALARFGKQRVDRIEFVVFYHPTHTRIYQVPPHSDLSRAIIKK